MRVVNPRLDGNGILWVPRVANGGIVQNDAFAQIITHEGQILDIKAFAVRATLYTHYTLQCYILHERDACKSCATCSACQ